MQTFIGTRTLASVRREQELQLGQVLSKKVGTIDYDFPGAGYYVRPRANSAGIGSEIGIVPKGTIFYRQTVSPYKYAPLTILKIDALVGTSTPYSDFQFVHSDAYALGYAATYANTAGDTNTYIQLWDNSAAKFSDFVSDVKTFSSNATVVANSMMSNAAVSDLILLGQGAADVRNWVVFDEQVNLRSDANPVAVSADILASLIYDGRMNADSISQWDAMSSSLRKEFRENCGRLFVDTL